MSGRASDSESLRDLLVRIDGRGYKAYKEIGGTWEFPGYLLHIDHVQGDPFADPSRCCVEIGIDAAGIDRELLTSRLRRVALGDYVGRAFREATAEVVRGDRGIGKSGMVSIVAGGQEILERSSVVIGPKSLQCRFVLGLPARGRTILGRQAEEMLFHEVPSPRRQGAPLFKLSP